MLIGGCHPNDCHYQDGNYKTMRRVALLKPLLEQMGIEPDRLRLEWISAAEGEKLVRVMGDFVNTVRSLGPLVYGPIAERVGGRRAAVKGPGGPSAKAAAKPAAKRAAPAKKAAKTAKRAPKTAKKRTR